MTDGCELCEIQQRSERGENPGAVARLSGGYVGLNPLQFYLGYTFFSSRQCVREVYDLDPSERALHLHQMTEVAHAVQRAFEPAKMNIDALGNGVPHLHWHIVPRHVNDQRPFAPIWENLDYLRAVWTNTESDRALLQDAKQRLVTELERADVEVDRFF